MSEEIIDASEKFHGKRVIFTVPGDETNARFSIRSEFQIEGDIGSQPDFSVPVPTVEAVATPEDLNKAVFLTDEARKGKSLIVKVMDAEKFRSRIVPEELCVNMKERRVCYAILSQTVYATVISLTVHPTAGSHAAFLLGRLQ
jgi:hypothetical protein